MSEKLKGSTAIVTGASSGIGEATALALAEQGADVAVVARRKDRLEQLSARVEKLGGRCLVIEADVTEESQARGAIEQTVNEWGRLDTLINNAGVMLLGPAASAPLDEWQRMIDLNLSGLLYCTHAALPHLVEAAASGSRGVADLVNVSSVAGRVARAGSGVYNATKFGVGALTESLRQEYAKAHVRVSVIEPGAVDTELRTHLRAEILPMLAARFGDVEILQSEDIADAIAYMVTRPRRMAVNEMLIRPTEQDG